MTLGCLGGAAPTPMINIVNVINARAQVPATAFENIMEGEVCVFRQIQSEVVDAGANYEYKGHELSRGTRGTHARTNRREG